MKLSSDMNALHKIEKPLERWSMWAMSWLGQHRTANQENFGLFRWDYFRQNKLNIWNESPSWKNISGMFKQQSRVIWSHFPKYGELVSLLIPQTSTQYEIDSFIFLVHYLDQNKDLNAIVNRKYYVNKTAIVVAPCEQAFRFRSVIFFQNSHDKMRKTKVLNFYDFACTLASAERNITMNHPPFDKNN